MTLKGYISSDEVAFVYNKHLLKNWLKKNAGKLISIKFLAEEERRSLPQNSYYWSVVIPHIIKGLEYAGYMVGEIEAHEFLKVRFNSVQLEIKDGEMISIPRTTTDLNTIEFMTYLERIKVFASESLGIYIPEPNEQSIF